MQRVHALIVLLAAHSSVASAAELQPQMTTTQATLLSEDFAGDALPKSFREPTSQAAFSVVDHAMQAVSRTGQGRATHGVFAVTDRDITIAFRVKFIEPGVLYIGVDGYNEMYQGNAHLVRFSLTPERFVWDQKRGGPASKRVVGEAMKGARAARKPIAVPTPEQLADPTFFRTEELAAAPLDCPVGQWHDVLLEINGNELVAQVDGHTLLATATVADAQKSRVGIGLTGRSTLLIDDFRILANTRRPDWEQVKAKLVERSKR